MNWDGSADALAEASGLTHEEALCLIRNASKRAHLACAGIPDWEIDELFDVLGWRA